MKTSLRDYEKSTVGNLNDFQILLFHGSDRKKIMKKSVEAANIICGQNSVAELRLQKFPEAAVLKDQNLFFTNLQTASFFPGERVLLIEDGTEKITKLISDCIDQFREGDGKIILTTGPLKGSSSLRKLLDSHPKCLSVAIYDENLDSVCIEKILKENELVISDRETLETLKNHQELLSSEDLLSFVEKLKLYKLYDHKPITQIEVEELMLGQNEINDQDLPNFLASGQASKMLVSMRRLVVAGTKPNQITNFILRHFTLLYQVKLNTKNSEAFFRTTYPPIFGKRKSTLLAQTKFWNITKLERALKIIRDTDKALRSSSRINPSYIVERSFLRITSLIKKFD